MKARLLVACAAVTVTMPLAASAEQAFTAVSVEVFAGPSSEYPPIAQLPPNTQVTVAGCLSDWSWCDVGFANDRGWIYAGDLVVPYQGSRVVIIDYGPRIHFFPVITFSLVTYWDRYYHSRPFYAQRQEWVSRVHITANHGGRAPAGHEHTARQSVPPLQSQQAQQAPVQTARPAEKNARPAEADRARTTERTQSAQTEKARTAATQRTVDKATAEKARTAQAQRAPRASPQPKEAQQPQVAQSPRTEQPQPRQERKAPETQPSHTAQVTERQHQAQQPPKAAPRPQQESRPPEANRREAGNAPHEEKKQEGKAE